MYLLLAYDQLPLLIQWGWLNAPRSVNNSINCAVVIAVCALPNAVFVTAFVVPISLCENDILAVPLKDLAVLPTVIFLAVANLVADPALPLTVVCNGWTWSLLATVLADPAAAVPLAFGAVVLYVTWVPWDDAALPFNCVCILDVTPST